jgi:hypothetical protein
MRLGSAGTRYRKHDNEFSGCLKFGDLLNYLRTNAPTSCRTTLLLAVRQISH